MTKWRNKIHKKKKNEGRQEGKIMTEWMDKDLNPPLQVITIKLHNTCIYNFKWNSSPGFEDSVLLAFWPTPGDFLDEITGKRKDTWNNQLQNWAATATKDLYRTNKGIYMNLSHSATQESRFQFNSVFHNRDLVVVLVIHEILWSMWIKCKTDLLYKPSFNITPSILG